MVTSSSPSKSYQEHGLIQQGYHYGSDELRELSWGLRFTPLVCMGFALLGLFLKEPLMHFSLAALGILPFWFPRGHPVDLIYNRLLRPLWNGVVLPPNPLPRRIACFMGGMMNLAIGLFFIYKMPNWAYSFGAVLISLQLVVIFTHFCLASWIFEKAVKLVGQWHEPISQSEFLNAMKSNGVLVDVRGPEEFANGHLPHAVNIPFETLEDQVFDPDKTFILYCQSGIRSYKGVKKLKAKGLNKVLNLGGMERAVPWVNETV